MSLSLVALGRPLAVVIVGVALIAPATAHAAAPLSHRARPDVPEVRTSVVVDVTGEWTGRVAFGTHAPGGQSRALRPLPLEVDLSRSACDLTGCMTTRLLLDAAGAVPAMARISGRLTSAALARSSIAVRVQRIVDGSVVAEHIATVTLEVSAQKSGALVKRTTLTQGPDGEVMSIARIAPVRATLLLADTSLTGVGELSRVQTVK
jgi:hypothetical protein